MNYHKFAKVLSFQMPLSLALLFAFWGLMLGALMETWWCLGTAMVLSTLLVLGGHYVCFKGKFEFSRPDATAEKLSIAADVILALSLSCSAIRFFKIPLLGFSVVLLCASVGLLLMAAMKVFYLRRVILPALPPSDSKFSLRSYLPIAILSVILILLNLEIFDAWFRWDSYDYFYYFPNASYPDLTKYVHLRPANHAAYGCSIIFLVVNGILNNPALSLYLINLLVLLTMAFAFWRILTIAYPHWSSVTRGLMTALVALSPYLFGLVWSISLDYFLAFGLILYFWGQAERLPILQVAAALMICFSKETGALLLAMIILARFVTNFLRKETKSKPFFSKLELHLALPILGFGLFWLGEVMLNNWIASNSATIETVDGAAFNGFALNPVYIMDRLKSFAFTNLTWVVLAVFAVALIVALVRRLVMKQRTEYSEARAHYAVSVLVGLLASFIPMLLFVTYNHVRYATATVVLLLLLLPEALDRLLKKDLFQSVLCGGIAVLFLVQSYVTIDPFMHLFYNKVEKGACGAIVYTDNRLLARSDTSRPVTVAAQYNREIMYFDDAMDDLLSKIDYKQGSTVLTFSDEYREPTIGGYVYSEYLIFGYGYKHMPAKRYITWDPVKNERYLDMDPEQELNYKGVSSAQNLGAYVANPNLRCIYIQFPFANPDRQAELFSHFNVAEIARGTSMGWELVAYEVTAKTN
ncbi:MAG: hypothetical protein IKA76_05215 [Clostridia bacterium]|nr:hypothetical protein [Clostridia bacterium]